MTTRLSKPVRRVPAFVGPNRRQFVVELAPPDIICFRDLRSRKRYEITLGACYEMAIRSAVARQKRERAAKRKTAKRSER